MSRLKKSSRKFGRSSKTSQGGKKTAQSGEPVDLFFQKSIFGRILSSKFDFWVNFEIKIDLWVNFSAQKSIFELKIDSQINF
jgi:hypothetical protein